MTRPNGCTGAGGRGCNCGWHQRRRVYHRLHARAARAAALQERNRIATTCQHRHGGGYCGTVLEARTDGNGRTIVVCPMCERRRAGICRDCPAPVAGQVGKSVRCARCKVLAQKAHIAAAHRRRADEIAARRRQQHRQKAKRRDASYLRKLEYKRAWRKANRDKVRAQKRRAALRQPEHVLAYMRQYRADRRAERAALERARYHAALTPRTCLTPGCDIVVTGRKKKCARCKERERQAAEQLLAARRGRGRRVDLEGAA